MPVGIHWRRVRQMSKPTKRRIQDTLDALVEEKGLPALFLDLTNQGYAARQCSAMGTPHPQVEIVTKRGQPVTVLWQGKEYRPDDKVSKCKCDDDTVA